MSPWRSWRRLRELEYGRGRPLSAAEAIQAVRDVTKLALAMVLISAAVVAGGGVVVWTFEHRANDAQQETIDALCAVGQFESRLSALDIRERVESDRATARFLVGVAAAADTPESGDRLMRIARGMRRSAAFAEELGRFRSDFALSDCEELIQPPDIREVVDGIERRLEEREAAEGAP